MAKWIGESFQITNVPDRTIPPSISDIIGRRQSMQQTACYSNLVVYFIHRKLLKKCLAGMADPVVMRNKFWEKKPS